MEKIMVDSTAIGDVFNIKDYLEATTDASNRTRTVTVILVIASVLIFIGYWNSFYTSWATERLRAAYDKEYSTKYKMLFSEIHKEKDINTAKYEDHLQEQVVKAYIDNVRFIKLPFFGIAVEVNDLGVIGGLSLIIILVLLRFSLSREIKNLNLSFKEAFHHNQLCEFYHALAMKQVLTIPEMTGEERNPFLSNASKFVYVIPVLVILMGVFYDFYSSIYLELFPFNDVINTHLSESIFLELLFGFQFDVMRDNFILTKFGEAIGTNSIKKNPA